MLPRRSAELWTNWSDHAGLTVADGGRLGPGATMRLVNCVARPRGSPRNQLTNKNMGHGVAAF
jgi:hypothetical protein